MSSEIKIGDTLLQTECYSMYNTYLFAWVNKNIDNVVNQVGGWHFCRELLISEIHRYLRLNGYLIWPYSLEIDFTQLKLCVRIRQSSTNLVELEKNFDEIVRVLNIFENKYNWPTTEILKFRDLENTSLNVIFLGPKEWLVAPQILSLFLFIVRLVGNQRKIFEEFKNVEDLKKIATLFHKNCCRTEDVKSFLDIYHAWPAVFNNYDILFNTEGSFEKSLIHNYTENTHFNGIHNLIIYKVITRNLIMTWRNILKNERKEK